MHFYELGKISPPENHLPQQFDGTQGSGYIPSAAPTTAPCSSTSNILYDDVPSVSIPTGSSSDTFGEDQEPSFKLINNYDANINRIYQDFITKQELTGFPTALHNIECWESLYKKTHEINPEEAEMTILPKLQEARKLVQEMNMKSPTLTSLDAKGIQSFFEKPIERYYIDHETGIRHIQPDHSQLLKIGGSFMAASGGYQSIGLSREEKCGDRVCDILYLKKCNEQIQYEKKKKREGQEKEEGFYGGLRMLNPFSFLPSSGRTDEEIQQIIATQERNARELIHSLEKDCISWGYDRCVFYTYEGLAKFFPKKTAEEHHAILFLYKKAG